MDYWYRLSSCHVVGEHEFIDVLVAPVKDPPSVKVFASKFRVGCAFRTPLMEMQEALFKDGVGATPLSQDTHRQGYVNDRWKVA